MNSYWEFELNEIFYFNQNIWDITKKDRFTYFLEFTTDLGAKGGLHLSLSEHILMLESLKPM